MEALLNEANPVDLADVNGRDLSVSSGNRTGFEELGLRAEYWRSG